MQKLFEIDQFNNGFILDLGLEIGSHCAFLEH